MSNTTIPTFTPVAELSYAKALAELESIVQRMQSDTLDIDLLAAYTRRATELLTECRRRLVATEEEIRTIIQ